MYFLQEKYVFWVDSMVSEWSYKNKEQHHSDCLFVHGFVCKPGASLTLSSASLTAVQPSGARGRTWGSIWCQFVWCRQGKVLCFSINTLTSEAREHLQQGRNSVPVKDVMYGERHAECFNKSMRTVWYFFLLPGKAEEEKKSISSGKKLPLTVCINESHSLSVSVLFTVQAVRIRLHNSATYLILQSPNNPSARKK